MTPLEKQQALEALEAELREAVLDVTRHQNIGGTTSPELLKAQARLWELEAQMREVKAL